MPEIKPPYVTILKSERTTGFSYYPNFTDEHTSYKTSELINKKKEFN